MKLFTAMLGVVMFAGCAFAQYPDAPSHDMSDVKPSHYRNSQTMNYTEDLPDAPSQMRPLTSDEKFKLFTDDARSPLTFMSAGITAGYNTVTNRVYGNGWDGFGKNYATAVAEHETSSFLGHYLFPTLLNQDPRYHPSEKDGFWTRGTYAASRVLITRNDFGKTTVNSSYLLGVLVSTAIASCYQPIHHGPGQTLVDFGSTVGGDAGMNVLREFWPQLRRKIRPMTPKKLRNLEDKLVGYEEPVGLADKKAADRQ